MEGLVEIEGKEMPSPVTKVTYSDMMSGRWRLHSNLEKAESLVSFAYHVAKYVLPGMILNRPGGTTVVLSVITDEAEDKIKQSKILQNAREAESVNEERNVAPMVVDEDDEENNSHASMSGLEEESMPSPTGQLSDTDLVATTSHPVTGMALRKHYAILQTRLVEEQEKYRQLVLSYEDVKSVRSDEYSLVSERYHSALVELDKKDKVIQESEVQIAELKVKLKAAMEGEVPQERQEGETWRELAEELNESYISKLENLREEYDRKLDRVRNDRMIDASRHEVQMSRMLTQMADLIKVLSTMLQTYDKNILQNTMTTKLIGQKVKDT